MFGKGRNSPTWKAEYDNTIYKVYDWKGNLAGYFFPHYSDTASEELDEETIEGLVKARVEIEQGTLLLPMVKLGLLDNHDGMDIDYVISSLQVNAEHAFAWKKWLQKNDKLFGIVSAAVYTAREDRNMLSIALDIVATIKLDEKEMRASLSPLLDRLHQDGLL